MVHLSRIYTRTGDDGTTGLGDGSRLPKHHLRVAAYGTTDELSSLLGVLLSDGCPEPWDGWLKQVQNDLFDVGADLCVPGEAGDGLRLKDTYVKRLEGWIDETNEDLQPLSSFVLPGGQRAAAWLHLARTVCRRAEREAVALAEIEPGRVNATVLRYLNRLSDLLFVLGRAANDGGRGDVLWQPGAGGGE